MERKACKKCPFRPHGLPYTQDGHEALDGLYEPNCHVIVGPNVFMTPPTGETICVGHGEFQTGNPDFQYPKYEEGLTP